MPSRSDPVELRVSHGTHSTAASGGVFGTQRNAGVGGE
jgi:hypothetical protein